MGLSENPGITNRSTATQSSSSIGRDSYLQAPNWRFCSVTQQQDEWFPVPQREGVIQVHVGSLRAQEKARFAERLWEDYFTSFTSYFSGEECEDIATWRSWAAEPAIDWDVTYARSYGQFVGGVHSRLLAADQLDARIGAFVEYLWLAEGLRGYSLFNCIVDRVDRYRRKQGASFLLAEIAADIKSVVTTSSDSPDKSQLPPLARLLHRSNFVVFDAPWIQPPQREDSPPDAHFLCISRGLVKVGEHITSDKYLQLWRQAYPEKKNEEWYRRMHLYCHEIAEVKAISLLKPRTFGGKTEVAKDFLEMYGEDRG